MKKQICLFLVNPIRLSDKHRIFQITGIGGGWEWGGGIKMKLS